MVQARKMDLRLFVEKYPAKGLNAMEKVGFLYAALTTILIVVMWNILHHPVEMLGLRVGYVVVTLAVARIYQRCPYRLAMLLRIALQFVMLIYWYPDTYEFNQFFLNLDPWFAATEQQLFGCQPSVEFCKAWTSPVVSELFYLGYYIYYYLVFGVIVACFLIKFEKVQYVAAVVVTSFFIYYLIYIFVPVVGPQFYFPAIGMDNVLAGHFVPVGDYFTHEVGLPTLPGYEGGWFHQLVESAHKTGECPTAAFPSSHVGLSTIVLFLAWPLSRKLTYWMLPFYVLLCASTVYIQAHYLIDVFAGWVSALLIYWLSVKISYYLQPD